LVAASLQKPHQHQHLVLKWPQPTLLHLLKLQPQPNPLHLLKLSSTALNCC
jgi:hypothetical protein